MEVSDRVLLGNGWVSFMGACLLGCLPPLPLACFLAPIPLTPFPSGEGGIFSFLMQGASPLASPGLGGTRHWGCLWKAGCGGGGLPSLSPAAPAFSLLCCPPSPKGKDRPPTRARRALFPAGRGRLRLSHARGFAPCIPGAGWDAALGLLVESGVRRGGLHSLPPADAAFSFLSCPHPPDPRSQSALPLRGRGRFLVFLCKGLRPLHPRGWTGCGTGFACRKRVAAVGLLFWLPAAPAFSLLCCPHPPNPLPRRGRGRLRLFHARGFAPCIPGAERGREPAIPAVPIPKAPCGGKMGHKP